MQDDDAERQTRKAQRAAKAEKLEVDEACRALLSTSRGRKYLWWLLTIGKVGTQPFSGNALATSFACGELNVGNQVLAHILEVDPGAYVQMMKERADADRTLTAADEPRADGADA